MTNTGSAAPASRVRHLPADISAALSGTRGDTAAMYPLLLSLSEQGWSLAALAHPFGVSREAVRIWLRAAAEADPERVEVPAPPLTDVQAAEAQRQQERDRARAAREEAADLALKELLPRLLELQADARALRGPSSSSPAFADASAEYTALLNEALTRGVSAARLADELGIRPVTIYARLRRGGYRDKSPSERRPSWADSAPVAAGNRPSALGLRVAV